MSPGNPVTPSRHDGFRCFHRTPGTRPGVLARKAPPANTTTALTAAQRRSRRQADAYIGSLIRKCAVLLTARGRVNDLDDITDVVLDRFLADPARAMSEFPDPQQFAKANIAQCTVLFDRRERKGRCSGTRLEAFEDQAGPGRRVARPWASFDAMHVAPSGEQFSLYDVAVGTGNGDVSLEDIVADRLDAQRSVERLTEGIDPEQLRCVELVDAYDLEVKEVAASRGITREAMSRKVNRTRAALRRRAVELAATGTRGGTA